jgi:hypothetical protein
MTISPCAGFVALPPELLLLVLLPPPSPLFGCGPPFDDDDDDVDEVDPEDVDEEEGGSGSPGFSGDGFQEASTPGSVGSMLGAGSVCGLIAQAQRTNADPRRGIATPNARRRRRSKDQEDKGMKTREFCYVRRQPASSGATSDAGETRKFTSRSQRLHELVAQSEINSLERLRT